MYPTIDEIIDKEWHFPGDAEVLSDIWKVWQLISEGNMYRYTRLTGEDSFSVEIFDVRYVITQYVEQEKIAAKWYGVPFYRVEPGPGVHPPTYVSSVRNPKLTSMSDEWTSF